MFSSAGYLRKNKILSGKRQLENVFKIEDRVNKNICTHSEKKEVI